jgi:segregation and condensation protein A
MTESPKASDPTGEPSASDAPKAEAGGGYRVELPTFEGPLDLLLHLIEEHELDIREIPIAFIAQKYVEYILLMQELNIDVASEYLVMAATLAHIKSKMLLPSVPDDQSDEDEDSDLDPRAELIRRLLEYQKYKHAAERLAAHDVLGRDVFPRGLPAPAVDGPAPLSGLNLFKLLDAFQGVLSRAKANVDHQIDFERFSITDRINELSDLLRNQQRLSFEQLFQGQISRADLIVTFLALLEMTRLRLTRLFQSGPLEEIFVELAVTDGLEPSEDLDAETRGAVDDGEGERSALEPNLLSPDQEATPESSSDADQEATPESSSDADQEATPESSSDADHEMMRPEPER